MIEYKVIASDTRHIEKEVNRMIQEGWELKGDPSIADNRMIQAMTRELKPVKAPTIKKK
jgi:hypothetical protein